MAIATLGIRNFEQLKLQVMQGNCPALTRQLCAGIIDSGNAGQLSRINQAAFVRRCWSQFRVGRPTHKPDNFAALLLAQARRGNCHAGTKQVLELTQEAGFAWGSPRQKQAGVSRYICNAKNKQEFRGAIALPKTSRFE